MKRKAVVALVILLLFAAGLRLYRADRLLPFSFDQERDAWVIKAMVDTQRPVLIGPEIAGRGFFLGPLYYYLLLPAYLVFNLDPGGTIYLPLLLSLLSVTAFYLIGRVCCSVQAGLLAAFIYAGSAFMVQFDHVPWNVNLMIPLSLLIFYWAHQVFIKNKPAYLPGLFFCLGLYFHAHFTAIVFLAGTIILLLLKRLAVNKSVIVKTSVAFLAPLLPLIIFDLRHNWLNLRHVWLLLFSQTSRIISNPAAQFLSMIDCQISNLSQTLFYQPLQPILFCLKILLAIYFINLIIKTASPPRSWNIRTLGLFYMLFFALVLSFYTESVPEYYFFSVLPLALLLFSQDAALFISRRGRNLLIIIGTVFVLFNFYTVLKAENSNSLYYKRRLVEFVITEAKGPFQLNYTTAVNFDNGYRYLFDLYKAPIVNDKQYPAFTLVSPHDFSNIKSDYRFGIIGLVGPVYEN